MVVLPLVVRPMNPWKTGIFPALMTGLQVLDDRGIGEVKQDAGPREIVIRDDALPGVHELSRHAVVFQDLCEDCGGQAFAVAGHCIHDARRQFAQSRQSFDQVAHLLEVGADRFGDPVFRDGDSQSSALL